jgi:hypothetical protein
VTSRFRQLLVKSLAFPIVSCLVDSFPLDERVDQPMNSLLKVISGAP